MRTMLPLLALALLTAGCGKRAPQGDVISWESCLRELVRYDHLPRLDDRAVTLYSSHDRTGGNNDFNNAAGPGSEPGWVALVDLKGPGVIRRFWMTGTDPGHPLRIYIDGEKTPRLYTTLDALFGQLTPWLPPLAQYVNMCYYSYIPITYNKSIRIETREANTHPFWGPRRLFFQIAAETLPPGTQVESYPATMTPAQLAAADEVRDAWHKAINGRAIPTLAEAPATVVAPGARADLFSATGSGTVTEWAINVAPADPAAWSRIDQEFLLQDTILRVYYDGSDRPAIDVPLGGFFANAWRKRAYGGWWFTSSEDGYTCRLPMPFASGLRVEIENGADQPINVNFAATQRPGRAANDGYLHAEYRRSGPANGQPHLVTRINGRGKYLGCFLGVTGLDESWWILEGDERIWVDGQTQPVWHGTGLEDYFNGGWYYRGSVFGSLNANYDRSPFRVAQFRHQHPDPVSFQTFFQMEFERMNDEHTGQPVKGWFQSVAYFYAAQPLPVEPVPSARTARRAIENPRERPTFMLQLVELERANDFHGAMRYVEEFLERYPQDEEAGVYRLRHLEYRRFLGEAITEADYAPFLVGQHGEAAKAQAELLIWFQAAPDRALVGFNVNGRGRLWLNNNLLLSGDHPFNLFVAGVELTNGLQNLAVQADFQRAEPWVQVGIRTHEGFVGTGPGTWCNRTVDSGWRTAEAAAPAWHAVDLRDVPRGVPDAPYIGGIANAFILLQSKSYPVRGLDWGYYRGAYAFRQDFTHPLPTWPAYAPIMTGLKQ